MIEFAGKVLGRPLDPWQEWLVIHAGELLPDGRPRFRELLVLVARQNGKTELLVILSLYWLFVEQLPLILGTSTNLDYARESWQKAVDLATGHDILAEDIPVGRGQQGIRFANGEQTLSTVDRCRYKIAAANRRGGRSLTVHRLICDEFREHGDWSAYDAASNAMNAVAHAQAWLISNMGDARSVPLKAMRKSALHHMETGEGDDRLGLFEWSAPEGADPTSSTALAQANPNLGYRLDPGPLLGRALRAKEAGAEQLAGFRTEVMCQDVPMLEPAVDADAWHETTDERGMEHLRDRLAACVDVSLDGRHAALVVAAVESSSPLRIRAEVVSSWSGPQALAEMRKGLPALVKRVKPRVLGWFPSGPAAAMTADMGIRWPAGVSVSEIKGEATAVCMGLAELIGARCVLHPQDDLLAAHVTTAEKLWQGDAWRFTRRGDGHVNGAYALAGAVHLARTLPPSRRARLITAKSDV